MRPLAGRVTVTVVSAVSAVSAVSIGVAVTVGVPVGMTERVRRDLAGQVHVPGRDAQPADEREHDERGDGAARPSARAQQGMGERFHVDPKV